MSNIINILQNATSWPFIEARQILKRIDDTALKKGYVLFETGYGPSGLPHIGTFGEVVRTSMVRFAFSQISDIPTKLYAFSDDMDGLRKVPDNIPNKGTIVKHLNKPLTQVPDPFGTHESFGEHNNARLKMFLDSFNFDYEFKSSTKMYKSGVFDDVLLQVLDRYDDIMQIMLPSLRKERKETYSPFLPICQDTGQVLQVPIIEKNLNTGTIVYRRNDDVMIETPITGGHCKLQWKPDWAMRWAALGVDYEMSGKDLIESVKLSGKICKTLGASPPINLSYELFLDENGEKISKSKGNGLSIEDWLNYAPADSLSLFMYQKPRTAKRLFFDIIPKTVDEYFAHLEKFEGQSAEKQIENPVWHIHQGAPPNIKVSISFNILLNLVSVCHTEDKSVIWHFINRYRPNLSKTELPMLDKLIEHAICFYKDFIRPHKQYRNPTLIEVSALKELREKLKTIAENFLKDYK